MTSALALNLLWISPDESYCGESAEPEPGSGWTFRWGGVYTSGIELEDDFPVFPWNDRLTSYIRNDRVALMLEAGHERDLHLFMKGATGWGHIDGRSYGSRFFIDQGHLSAMWRNTLTGKLFLNERILRNRNRLLNLISNDSRLMMKRTYGVDAGLATAGPASVKYSFVAIDRQFLRGVDLGMPSPAIDDDFIHMLEGGFDGNNWHAGLTAGGVWDSGTDGRWYNYNALYGFDGGVELAGGSLNLEFARSSDDWESFGGGVFNVDLDRLKWGSLSESLPEDGVLAAEWTGAEWTRKEMGTFGFTPGYRYSGVIFEDYLGEVPAGHVESYIETWWRHAVLASLVSVRLADRYDYRSGRGGAVLGTSIWSRWNGGVETSAGGFFADGSRPVLIISAVDDNSLSRLTATARLDDTGGENELSFITEATVKLGRRWSIGGSVYLERSCKGFYTADIDFRWNRRFWFRASTGTYNPASINAALNHDPDPPATGRDRKIVIYTRVWLGGL